MSRTRAIALSLSINRTSAVFAALIACGAFAYGVLLLLTVMHAAGQHRAEARVRDLSVQVAQLEARYLAQTQAITPATVSELGFVKPTHIATVYTGGGANTLSLRPAQQ